MKRQGAPDAFKGDSDENRVRLFAQQLTAFAKAVIDRRLTDDIEWWFNDKRTPTVYKKGYNAPKFWAVLIPRLIGCDAAKGHLPRWTACVEEVNRKFKDSCVVFYYVVQPEDEHRTKSIIADFDKTLFSTTQGFFDSEALSEIRKPLAPAPFSRSRALHSHPRPAQSGWVKPAYNNSYHGSASSHQPHGVGLYSHPPSW